MEQDEHLECMLYDIDGMVLFHIFMKIIGGLS